MPVRTELELANRLDGEMAWRKRELTILRFRVERGPSREQETMIRSSLCMLYAHWEGFVTIAANSYLQYVANRQLEYRRMKWNFMSTILAQKLRNLALQNNTKADLEIINIVMGSLGDKMPKRTVRIGGKSNLNSRVFEGMLLKIGLEDNLLDAVEISLLDKTLVRYRNGICHGERLETPVGSTDYVELHDRVVRLMNRFKNRVQDAASQKDYRVDG